MKKQKPVILMLFFGCCLMQSLTAQIVFALGAPRPPEILSQNAILVDASSGAVFYEKNADQVWYPASLSKLMTMHLILNDIYAGKCSLSDIVEVPAEAAWYNLPPESSLMWLAEGMKPTLYQCLLGMAVPSGNDAAYAAVLHVSPTLEDFTRRMNAEAARLGMKDTFYHEPSGVSEKNLGSARDVARFCVEYIKAHPEAMQMFHSVKLMEWEPAPKPRTNHNGLLYTYPGVDGLKTGHIEESGWNIAYTAKRGDRRFILVLFNAQTEALREADGTALLDWAFANF
jgi:D-alanyl-D-alanine carboxypeptidase (penicillin-binding protein 5/6)